MADDLDAIKRFAHGARRIEINTPPLSTRLWTAEQYRRGSARTKALALMLAAAGPRDLRSGNRISTGESLAMANEMQLSRGGRLREPPPTDEADDPVIIEHALTTEIVDEDTTD